MLTEWQQKMRKCRVGGSEAGSILGINKFETQMDFWLRKQGHIEDKEESEDLIRGQELGPGIVRMYARLHDREVVDYGADEVTHISSDYPLCVATPDGIDVTDGEGKHFCVEIKSPRYLRPEDWGDEHSDHIPPMYNIQAQWQMAATGLTTSVRFVVLHFGQLRFFEVPWSEKLFTVAYSTVEKWWEKHMVEGHEPVYDGGKRCAEWLAKRYPGVDRGKEDREILDGAVHRGAINAYLAAKSRSSDAERDLKAAKQQVQSIIGDADGVEHGGVKLLWTRVKGKATLNHKALIAELGATEEQIAKHTKRGAGHRSLCTYIKKGE